MGRIIGIDLGTTNSLAAYWQDGKSILIPNALGEYLTPSVVSIDENGTLLVGKTAKERLISDPDNTICEFKRGMGTERRYSLGKTKYKAQELSAMVLKSIKNDAEKFLNDTVDEAVISVPAYFNDKARKATREAGLIAGLKVERIINEPSAAALEYRHMYDTEDGKLLILDFGGGTLDVSLVDCFENVVEILAVSGDNRLGGMDFNYILAKNFCSTLEIIFEEQDAAHQQILLRSAERVKRLLTLQDSAYMSIGGEDVQCAMPVSRRDLIKMTMPIMNRIIKPVMTVLKDAKVSPEQLKGTVLVGGSCKMPIIQDYLKYILKSERIKAINPDYMIALGVGIYAGIKESHGQEKELMLTDLCPFSLGTDVRNESDSSNTYMSVIIPRNSPLPCSRENIYCTSHDNQTSIYFGVYQGEDMYANNNLKLAELKINDIPKAPAGKERLSARFTYDINGLLFVDLKILSTGEEKHLTLGADGDDEELQRQMKMLNELRFDPRESQEVKLLRERASRIFQQLTDESERTALMSKIKQFDEVLSSQNAILIHRECTVFGCELNDIENRSMFDIDIDDSYTDDFLKWYDSDKDDDEDLPDWMS